MRTSGPHSPAAATAVAAIALLLAGCAASRTGSDAGRSPIPSIPPRSAPASNTIPSATPVPSRPPSTPSDGGAGPSGDHVRGIVAAGGAARGPLEKVSTTLTDEAAVQEYKARLAPSLQKPFLAEAEKLMKQVPKGQYLHAQTVYDGCDVPAASTIAAKPTQGGIALTVKAPPRTKQECFTAERSVAFYSIGKMVG